MVNWELEAVKSIRAQAKDKILQFFSPRLFPGILAVAPLYGQMTDWYDKMIPVVTHVLCCWMDTGEILYRKLDAPAFCDETYQQQIRRILEKIQPETAWILPSGLSADIPSRKYYLFSSRQKAACCLCNTDQGILDVLIWQVPAEYTFDNTPFASQKSALSNPRTIFSGRLHPVDVSYRDDCRIAHLDLQHPARSWCFHNGSLILFSGKLFPLFKEELERFCAEMQQAVILDDESLRDFHLQWLDNDFRDLDSTLNRAAHRLFSPLEANDCGNALRIQSKRPVSLYTVSIAKWQNERHGDLWMDAQELFESLE